MNFEVAQSNPLDQVYFELARLGKELANKNYNLEYALEMINILHKDCTVLQEKVALLEHDNRYLRAKVTMLEQEMTDLARIMMTKPI